MNKVVLIGKLTKDAELKFAQGTGTAVATFTLAKWYVTKGGNYERQKI